MKLLIDTLNKKHTTKTPIWIMRQAGRYLPEYKKLRGNFSSFMEFCMSEETVCEATIQPLRRFDLDAAIIFSDILVIPYAMGIEVNFLEKVGPVLKPLITYENVKDFIFMEKIDEKNVFQKVFNSISMVRKELDKNFQSKALIGFAGSPWTVACYMCDSRNSKDFYEVRSFAYNYPEYFSILIDRITEITIQYLRGHIISGADVIKLFDSWAGVLPEDEFYNWVIKPSKKIVSELKREFPYIPIICFPRGAGVLYKNYAYEVNPDCIAIDHTIPVSWAYSELSEDFVIQGNLDNVLLTCKKNDIRISAEKILQKLSSKNFIFNLGHGILQNTIPENLDYLVNIVHNYKK